MTVCAHLHLDVLARLARVSRLWAEAYKARLSAEQQRLKSLVAVAQPGPTGAASHEPLLSLLPTHFPPSPTPLTRGCWMTFSSQRRGWPTHYWCETVNSIRIPCLSFGSSGTLELCCFGGIASPHKLLSVLAEVGRQEDMPLLLGLLLVLLQDRLPCLRFEHGPSTEQSGGLGPSWNVSVNCMLPFGSSLSMWAPLGPLLRELQFFRADSDILSRTDDHDDSKYKRFSARRKRVVFYKAGKFESEPHLDVTLGVSAPSWEH